MIEHQSMALSNSELRTCSRSLHSNRLLPVLQGKPANHSATPSHCWKSLLRPKGINISTLFNKSHSSHTLAYGKINEITNGMEKMFCAVKTRTPNICKNCTSNHCATNAKRLQTLCTCICARSTHAQYIQVPHVYIHIHALLSAYLYIKCISKLHVQVTYMNYIIYTHIYMYVSARAYTQYINYIYI